MPFTRKYMSRKAKSVARPLRRGARARYVPKNKRGRRQVNISNIIKDVKFLKRQLNTEWKNTGEITHGFDTTAPELVPTSSAPIVQALPFPATQGLTGINDRVGKKVKIVNMHMRWRLRLTYDNADAATKLDPVAPIHYKIYVVWEKRLDYPNLQPTDKVLNLFKDDPIGNKSYISQFDPLEYKDYLITYKKQGVMRFPNAAQAWAYQANQVRYMEHNIPLSIHQEFDDDNVLQQNRPWLIILTDNASANNEALKFSLITKMSYVDN